MQANVTLLDVGGIVANVLGIIAVLLVVAVVTNTPAPFITSDRAAFIALAVVGFTMCAVGGIGRAQATLGWAHPITIVGIVLGVLALLLIAAVLTGRAGFLLPLGAAVYGDSAAFVSADRLAFIALAGLMLLKWALGLGSALLR